MSRFNSFSIFFLLLVGVGWVGGCQPSTPAPVTPAVDSPTPEMPQHGPGTAMHSPDIRAGNSEPTPPQNTLQLFDGNTLSGWEATNFGGEGECNAIQQKLVLEAGYPMTGVTSTRDDLPTMNYELSLEVQRTSGIDFFCGLTFPVADSHCSFIVGGWAGSVVGLSCVDGQDASRNETRRLMTFEKNRWYRIKVRVLPQRIAAWIDDQQVVDLDITGREISVRNETLACRPLGVCNFETCSEFRNIQLTELSPEPAVRGQFENQKNPEE